MDTTIALIITCVAIFIFFNLLKKYFNELKEEREKELLNNINLAFLVDDAENNIETFIRYLENNENSFISKFKKIIFIKNNSKDDTFKILEKLSKEKEYIEIRTKIWL